jgi:hypothetical protein
MVQAVISQGMKRLGREADHSPTSGAEFKNETSILPHIFMAW